MFCQPHIQAPFSVKSMLAPSQISIVIPAYNEESAIEGVVSMLSTELPDSEILVIDDGSTDATKLRAEQGGARTISHQHNSGYGASLHTGVQSARNPFILICDGDGQHSASEALKLVHTWDDHDMVIGARGKDSYQQRTRAPGKWILRHFANFLSGQKLPDFNSGLRLVNRSLMLQYLHLMPAGFSFSTTSTFALLKAKARIAWVPVTVQKRSGKSQVRQWKHGPQTIMLMLRLIVLFEPLKVFLPIAGLLFVLALGSFGNDLSEIGKSGITDMTVILLISTLGVFLFSLLCDQISAIRREMHTSSKSTSER